MGLMNICEVISIFYAALHLLTYQRGTCDAQSTEYYLSSLSPDNNAHCSDCYTDVYQYFSSNVLLLKETLRVVCVDFASLRDNLTSELVKLKSDIQDLASKIRSVYLMNLIAVIGDIDMRGYKM